MTDRLSLTNALTDANIDRQKAERIATEIFDAIHENVATKADIDRLGARIDHVETALGARIDQVETALGARIDQVEAAFGARIDQVGFRIDQVEKGLRAGMRELELRLEGRIDRIVVRLGSVMVILAGIILAAIRYLPHS